LQKEQKTSATQGSQARVTLDRQQELGATAAGEDSVMNFDQSNELTEQRCLAFTLQEQGFLLLLKAIDHVTTDNLLEKAKRYNSQLTSQSCESCSKDYHSSNMSHTSS
jgi:hypothetical protein